jgi:hypothetical protein
VTHRTSTSRSRLPRSCEPARGLFLAAVLIALAGLLSGSLAVQPWVFVVVPVIALVTLHLRYLLRRWLHRARRRGQCLLPLMVAGDPATLRELIERTRVESHVGWRVEAVCTSGDARITARSQACPWSGGCTISRDTSAGVAVGWSR